ncbi:hypothetical protein [Thiohalophilus sp.]|uniref:hypothetical protein n=1 Tax=Thiohalophilus sp. TaxID=3028392 RepID=UPI002ACE06B9|nr:hypothetical protein [Thiohalophilus sp.]MDZ7804306.1 hypothetical protein [Thiohalophilus sp.]
MPCAKALREEVLQNLMLEIHRIKVIFSLTNIAASEMVAASLHDTNWNETEVSLPNLDSSTLQDKYEEHQRGIMKAD